MMWDLSMKRTRLDQTWGGEQVDDGCISEI